MEIISTSYINDKKYENCINIKDNLINSIIDYGNVKNLIIKLASVVKQFLKVL